LATVRERVAAYRADYRRYGRRPPGEAVKMQVLQPMTEVRAQLQEDLARLENARSLVPLDHDPVPDNYSELVRKYYEKLGGGQCLFFPPAGGCFRFWRCSFSWLPTWFGPG